MDHTQEDKVFGSSMTMETRLCCSRCDNGTQQENRQGLNVCVLCVIVSLWLLRGIAKFSIFHFFSSFHFINITLIALWRAE